MSTVLRSTMILIAAATGATSALAQTSQFADTSVAPPLVLESGGFVSGDTPSTKAHKLAQAIALRTEALRLQAADGGTLSAEHLAYVRGRAAMIRNGDRAPPTGSLIAVR